MAINEKNIMRHELIGLPVVIKKSTDPTQKRIRGIVIDETYNTLKIETRDGQEKLIPKKIAMFIFTLPNKKRVQIEGKILLSRPEDRIKKKFPRW